MTYPEEFPAEEPDEYDAFQSPAEVYAFVFSKEGESGLRELLARPLKDRTQEDLLDASAELAGAGLSAAAAVVTECAAAVLPMTDLSFCCYTADVPANRASWQGLSADARASVRSSASDGHSRHVCHEANPSLTRPKSGVLVGGWRGIGLKAQ